MDKKPIYLLDWDCENPREELEKDFEIKLDNDINILVAYYSYESYSGEAIVIFEQKGKFYEVTGGHCSCYGLEGQWSPTEITREYLNHRTKDGYWSYDNDDMIKQALIKQGLCEGEQK